VLGPAGHHIEIVDPNPTCICRFSHWTKRAHRCPPASSDPIGYLNTVNSLLATGAFDVLLPTHEQAWLFAVTAARLDPRGRIAVASAEAFSRVETSSAVDRQPPPPSLLDIVADIPPGGLRLEIEDN